ncbi:MAG: efflux RND transporter periplasmic adaptor subunit, partial [Planctomycetota bacterium]
ARARLAEARATERIVQLGSRDEELQLAAAEVEKAKAGVQRAQARLDLSLLRAPFDATVVRIDLEPGEVVNTIDSPYAQTGIEIADVSELWARLDVPETRIGWVRLGAPAEVVVEACGPDALAAEVIEIAPVADRESNTVSVAVRILEPPALIRPNMSARVTIREEKPK